MRYSQVSAGSWFYNQGIRRIFGLAILFQGIVRMWILMEIFGEEGVTFADFFKNHRNGRNRWNRRLYQLSIST